MASVRELNFYTGVAGDDGSTMREARDSALHVYVL